jgi:hypothetical protein
LTGDSRYFDAVRDATTYAMRNLADGGGLFYWGHHETYDALSDRVTGRGNPPIHEMKTMVPDFRYLYGLDPAAVKKNIEQYMIMGIRDWEKLDVDSVFPRDLYLRVRHAGPISDKVWDNEVVYCLDKPAKGGE